MKASEWAFDRIKEAFELVAQDEAEKLSIVQEINAQKYGLFAENHCARWRTRRSHNVVPVPKLQQFPSGRLRLVGLQGEEPQSGGAQCVEKSTYKQGKILSKPRSSKRMRYLKACAQI